MTQQIDSDLLTTVLQLLTNEGSCAFAEGLRLLVNEAMVQERSAVLQARPYERCEARLGRSNGFKTKTLATRVGPIEFRVPQVRDGLDFYPSALEKGIRSEQAFMLALAEMYVHGVSTRRVTKIVEDLCGHSVSFSQVSACAAKLVGELQAWRERRLAAYGDTTTCLEGLERSRSKLCVRRGWSLIVSGCFGCIGRKLREKFL